MRTIALLLLTTLLASCVNLGKAGGGTVSYYDLGPRPERAARSYKPILAVEVTAPEWIDSPVVHYRLMSTEPTRLYAYSLARWVAPPTQLIQSYLVQVEGFASPLQTRQGCRIRLDITEYAQHFSSPAQSDGVLSGKIVLLDAARRPLATKFVDFNLVASTPNASGGVGAMTQLVFRLGRALADLESEWRNSGMLKPCEA